MNKRFIKQAVVLSVILPVLLLIIILFICSSLENDVFSHKSNEVTDIRVEDSVQSQHVLSDNTGYVLAEINYDNIDAWDIDIGTKLADIKANTSQTHNYTRIPLFLQWDKNWGNYSYGESGTIASSGCGPSAFAMVVAGLTGRREINPKMMSDWSYANGHRAEGIGTAWSLFYEGADYFGIECSEIGVNPNEIARSLIARKPVIASMTAGHFTTDGHFIVLRGITQDGWILVNDPNSWYNSAKMWNVQLIVDEAVGAWSFSR